MSSFTNEPKKMNRKEEEIYNILSKKKEIDDKTPKLRTEDDKKELKSLSYKMRKFPKDLIDDIKTKFPFLQRTPKTAEQRKEQDKEGHSRKRSAESGIERERRQAGPGLYGPAPSLAYGKVHPALHRNGA